MWVTSWLRQLLGPIPRSAGRSRATRRRKRPLVRPYLEELETRVVPAGPGGGGTGGGTGGALIRYHPDYMFPASRPDGGPGDPTYAPNQLRDAYGFNVGSSILTFSGGLTADGKGLTIAIVDAYNDPNIATDLDTFDKAFSLTDSGPTIFAQYGAASSFLTVYDQKGNVINPASPPSYLPNSAKSGSGDWSIEESLDIQWAHSIAPGAKIDLVEADSAFDPDLIQAAVPTAAGLPGVSAVSMSFSESEFAGENSDDSIFVTPSGHQGVSFFAATGDYGSPSGYPAYSPNVVAVGGTSLFLNSDNSWQSETGWGNGSSSSTLGGSGGGVSGNESEPSYQTNAQNTGFRTNPDVASDADPNTGVFVEDTWDGFGLNDVGGTSLATPTWAALTTIANQGRLSEGGVTFDTGAAGPQQYLTFLYSLYNGDTSPYLSYFHDETTGNNGGFNAGTGYDLVTGIGSEIANSILPELASIDLPVIAPNALPSGTSGTPYSATVTASQGVGNKTMTISGLPAGLTSALSPNQIVISGTPSAIGTFSVTVTATDTIGDKVTKVYSLTIAPGITISPAALPSGFVDVAYPAQTVTASGGDGTAAIVSDSITANPTGLAIVLSGGQVTVSGTPTSGGTVKFSVTAADTDSPGFSVTRSYSFYIDAPVVTFTQQPRNTVSGVALGPVVVGVTGSVSGQPYGSPVFVTISVLSGPAGGTIVGGNQTVPTSTGSATFSGLEFITCGTYTLQASVSTTSGGAALSTAGSNSFQVTASQLDITAEPPGLVAAGALFGLTVMAEDASGNLASNFNGPVTMSLASQVLVGNLGTAQLSGSVVTAANGIATFTSLSLNHLGTFTVDAGSGSLLSARSTSIVVDAGVLVFTTVPTFVTSGVNFQLVVTAEDLAGNVDPSFGSTVTLGINGGPPGANLQESGSAPVTATASAGVATFSNLTLDKAGNYTLAASATPSQGAIGGTSPQFTVNPSALIFINSTPPATVVSGRSFGVQVEALDVTGIATYFTGQTTLSVAAGPGGIRGTTTASFANGVGTFSAILDHYGNYSLLASVPNGGPSVLSGIVSVTASQFSVLGTTTIMAGRPLNLLVGAVDDLGNVVPNFSGPVTAALVGRPFRAVVLGNLACNFANGILTLSGLVFGTPGTYTFAISSPSISNSISVTVPGSVGY